ncbi:MAG: hypothetical protein IKC69_07960 [Clostridia bacterium]|nr:hypothetical protein [Clostridia bacterium]
MHKEPPFGDFLDVDGVIREQAAAFPNTFVVRGFEYVPQDEAYFADLKLHPNDKGFALYDKNLWKDAEGFFAR